ncbi:MAG: glutamate--tRNA ligase, partial [Gammaproteobacteria bacterium]
VNRAASVFSPDKLRWLSQQHIMRTPAEHIARHLGHHLGLRGIDPAAGGPEILDLVAAQHERATTLVEMADISECYYRDFDEFDEDAAKKHLRPVAAEPLEKVKQALSAVDEWTAEKVYAAVQAVAAELDLKMGKVAQPLRVAVTGRAASPSIDVTLYLTGRDASLRRIDKALDYIARRAAQGQGNG